MNKRRFNKKMFWIILLSILSLGFFIAIIIIKCINPFKPSFYAYSSYVDPQTQKEINKKYTYKEYGTAVDFEYMLENNKAVAGITSDYSIIALIKEGKLAPIRKQVEEINSLSGNWVDYFSDESKEQMASYAIDETTQEMLRKKYPEYGAGYDFQFSDFVVPYFINDKVIAFDTKKIMNKLNVTLEDVNDLFGSSNPTMVEALKTLNSQDSNLKVQWTKNERENVAIGSTESNPEDNWVINIDDSNYNQLLNYFSQMVSEGTSASMSNIKVNLFDNDSDIILNNLINPSSKINTAMIYNGDALDAYYGHDNFSEITDGDRLRIVRSKYTIRILDCFVVSSSISEKNRLNLLKNFNDYLFNGMFTTEEQFNQMLTEDITEEDIFNQHGIMRIFNYVNYTPAAKGANLFIYNHYFKNEDGSFDEVARDIYKVAKNDPSKGLYVRSIPFIEKSVISKISLAFQRKLNGH